MVAGGWYLYRQWQAMQVAEIALEASDETSPTALDRRLLDAESELANLRRGQQNLEQRFNDARSRSDLLREEMLGLGQRAAIVEDNLKQLAEHRPENRDSLRLDEAELLLGLAQTRLGIAGDVAGAIHATALAEAALAALTDPELVNLRQTLADELAALRSLPADPRTLARHKLDALEAALPRLASSEREAEETTPRDGLGRLLDALVQVRASGEQDLLAPAERSSGEAALALELALARTALEQRDDTRFYASLQRIGGWLSRLYADSAALREQQQQLRTLTGQSLSPSWPALGRTLEQLRELRRPARPTP
ncbi:MAG TPA: uroporphyrinogen-III C-methyltransferase [Arenimonas sp.]|nr:uroporphyrinogen-III C-methyltransferase [Arenimonas sp.]